MNENRLVRQTVVVLLSALLMFSMMLLHSLTALAADWNVKISEDFEGMTVGQSPSGWATSGGVPPVVVSEGDLKALKFTYSGTVNRSVWSFAEQAGSVKLAVKVKASQTNSPLGIHILDAQEGEIFKLSLNLLGTVSYTNAGTFIDTTTAYEANKWLTLEAIVNRDNNNYQVLLDGVSVGTGNLGPSTKAIGKLRLQVPTNGENGSSFYVDRVSIAEPAPPAPVITLALDQSSYNLTAGTTHQLAVKKTENGVETDVTAQSVFTVSGSGIASVNASGLLEAIQAGTATVKATYQGVSAEAAVVVSAKQEEAFQAALAGPSVVKPGETISVHFGVKHAKAPLTGQDVLISYDASALQYVSANELAQGLKVVAAKSDVPGTLRLVVASIGTENAVIGTQPDLIEVKFQVKNVSDQVAQVAVTSALFGDAVGHEYSAATASLEMAIDAGVSGDLNGDSKVSIGDLAIMAVNYGKTSESPDWASIKAADLNNDGKIDVLDMAALAKLILQ